MFRNLNVRTKLMLVLSVPLIAMAGFAGIGAGERLADADRAGNVTALARVVRGQVDLSHQLETERLWSGITQTTEGGARSGAIGRAKNPDRRRVGAVPPRSRAERDVGADVARPTTDSPIWPRCDPTWTTTESRPISPVTATTG